MFTLNGTVIAMRDRSGESNGSKWSFTECKVLAADGFDTADVILGRDFPGRPSIGEVVAWNVRVYAKGGRLNVSAESPVLVEVKGSPKSA